MNAALVQAPYVPKETFSPSSFDLWDTCQRRWGFRYLAGIKTPRAPSAALGTRCHALLETYLKGGQFDLYSDEGKIVAVAIPHFPERHETLQVRSEHPFTFTSEPILHLAEPIVFNGVIDVQAQHVSGAWAVYDFKTTKSPKLYGKPVDVLAKDPQGVMYSTATWLEHGQDDVPVRWVYSSTDKREKAHAESRDVLFTRDDTDRKMHSLVVQAVGMRDLMRERVDPLELPASPGSCEKYGRPGQINCPYHVANGGRCDPGGRRLGDMLDLIQLGTPPAKDTPMTQQAPIDLQAQLAAIKARAQQAAPQPITTPPAFQPPTPAAPPVADGQTQVLPANVFGTPGAVPPQGWPAGQTVALPPQPVFAAPVASHVLPPESTQPVQAPPATIPAPPVFEAVGQAQGPFEPAKTEAVEEKPKRHRRTKAEIEAERAAQATAESDIQAGGLFDRTNYQRDALAVAIIARPELVPSAEYLPLVYPMVDEILKGR